MGFVIFIFKDCFFHLESGIRRIYFSDRLYSEEELPPEFKLFLPVPCRTLVTCFSGPKMWIKTRGIRRENKTHIACTVNCREKCWCATSIYLKVKMLVCVHQSAGRVRAYISLLFLYP